MRVDKVEWGGAGGAGGGGAGGAGAGGGGGAGGAGGAGGGVRVSASTGAPNTSGAVVSVPRHAPDVLELDVYNLLILDQHTFEGM